MILDTAGSNQARKPESTQPLPPSTLQLLHSLPFKNSLLLPLPFIIINHPRPLRLPLIPDNHSPRISPLSRDRLKAPDLFGLPARAADILRKSLHVDVLVQEAGLGLVVGELFTSQERRVIGGPGPGHVEAAAPSEFDQPRLMSALAVDLVVVVREFPIHGA